MAKPRPYAVNPGWRLLLRDMGINPANVLRRAELPADLFARDGALLECDEYFKFFRSIEEVANEPAIALRLGAAISVEAFDPPIFAALCSPNLNISLQRIARYKPLIGPMVMHVDVGKTKTAMTIEWPTVKTPAPAVLAHAELAFFVQLARIATRERICPSEVSAQQPAEPAAVFTRFFGVAVKKGKSTRLVFHADDAARPFLTVNEKMWEVFDSDLGHRLSNLDRTATSAERIRAALKEMLPGSAPSIAAVAQRLGITARTLQRRLQDESDSYQNVLKRTRQELASHYLRSTSIPIAEISYLLGYEDPNCFYRAYRAWTGFTPLQARERGGLQR